MARRKYGSGPRYGDFYKYTAAREVEGGGIKARSKRGDFAASWWGKRWLSVLGNFMNEGRLAKGRTYARKGQVSSLEVLAGNIDAAVQGSRPRPYKVAIQLDTFTDKQWDQIANHFSEDASMVANLLNGQLPENSESLFDDLKIKLLPSSSDDIRMDCNCPDYMVPCKHLAAVLYLIAEELDTDPFLLFQMRGKKRDEFLSLLDTSSVELPPTEQALVSEPLPSDAEVFWKSFGPNLLPALSYRTPEVSAVLPKRLGSLPFWQGESPFLQAMEEIYESTDARLQERLSQIEKDDENEQSEP